MDITIKPGAALEDATQIDSIVKQIDQDMQDLDSSFKRIIPSGVETTWSNELKQNWETIEQKEKTKALQGMWRNKAISDTYEPGSVFKLITASAALEEKITDTDNSGEFCCTGGITVGGARIKCWRYYRPHGPESLRQGLMNSCNPVFIGLGQKLGVNTYFSYLKKFGLLSKTGVNLPGEANSIFVKQEKCGPVELATISFGQRFEITPIQLVTAISSIVNGGNLLTPRVVKSIIDIQTGEEQEVPIDKKATSISKETSKKVLSMMESVVSEGRRKTLRFQKEKFRESNYSLKNIL